MNDFQAFPAPAKINLFLHITGRRPDGYHTLQSVFQLLDFADTIYLKPTQDGIIRRVNTITGVPEQQDLCVRAALALQQATNCQLGCEIRVEKHIPMGGGLGGGSSDAATVLLALNRLWNLNISRTQLIEIGVQLGADVPIFVFGRNAWAEGVGEVLTAIDLPERYFVVLTPLVHVATAQIFANPTLTRNTKPLKIADFSNGAFPEQFRNDLETVVCNEFPAVASTLKWLNQFGQARMSGSGASVFVAVDSQQQANEILAQRPANTSGFVAKSLGRHPLLSYTTD